MKIRKGDKVKVISGKDLGKEGTVELVLPNKSAIIVKGVNTVKKHIKPTQKYREGGIIELSKPISISNTALLCGECGKPTRVGYKLINDKKYRICKKCGFAIDRKPVSRRRQAES